MKKIFFIGLAVVAFAATAFAQVCVYPTDTVKINFKREVPGLLEGEFTINSSGGKVSFSQGNLQAVFASSGTSTCTWQFAAHQYDYVGNATANTAVGNNQVTTAGTVDLFGWVGASSSLAAYGINNDNTISDYGNSRTENLKSDWGTAMGAGWRTLTYNEIQYLLNVSNSSNPEVGRQGNRFAKATVHSKPGLIILPDGWTQAGSTMSATLENVNVVSVSNPFPTVSNADWTKLENEGAVFLPAAGYRAGKTITFAGTYGYYWTSTTDSSKDGYAFRWFFIYPSITFATCDRCAGCSVRLVQDL